ASDASTASGARPRLVCTMTPVAFRTSRRLDRLARWANPYASSSSVSGGSPPDSMRRFASATARRAASRACAFGMPARPAASRSTDGSARSRSARAGSVDPALLATLHLLLPDRGLRLDSVDHLSRAREGLLPMRGRDRHADA